MDIIRQDYLDDLYESKDNGMIKIITGVKRCGKSFIFNQFKNYLISKGINERQIIEINFEALEFNNLYNSKSLYNFVLQKTIDAKMYLLLDELWLVDNFESAINSLFLKDRYDIYISSSNNQILNNNFKKAFDKKYQEIKAFPLSFNRYCSLIEAKDKNEALKNYLKYGSLPHVSKIKDIETNISYIQGIYNTIILKDLIETKRINDLEILNAIIKYLTSSIGKCISTSKMALEISSTTKKVTPLVIEKYIKALIDSYIFYDVECFNIKSKLKVKGYEKYYISDLGFRIAKLGNNDFNVECSLENIVYFELLRRKYTIYVGKYDSSNVDFYVTKGKEKCYYQIIESTAKKDILNKKLLPLKNIKDKMSKIVLTLDNPSEKIEGITFINIIDWLSN